MRGIPGMQVFTPADEEDMLLMLPQIWHSNFPAYTRANLIKPIYQHDKDFSIGKAEVVSAPSTITFLVYGMLFNQVFQAKRILEENGHAVGLVNMRSLKPVDEDIIVQSVKQSELIVVVEDHFKTGGLYSIVAEVLLKHRLSANVHSISLQHKWFRAAKLSEVLEHEDFTSKKIAAQTILAFESSSNVIV
jgi:transketolase